MGREFVQYLPVVMPPLMKAAAIRPEVAMMDSQDAECADEDEGWEFVKMGEQVRGFRCGRVLRRDRLS